GGNAGRGSGGDRSRVRMQIHVVLVVLTDPIQVARKIWQHTRLTERRPMRLLRNSKSTGGANHHRPEGANWRANCAGNATAYSNRSLKPKPDKPDWHSIVGRQMSEMF